MIQKVTRRGIKIMGQEYWSDEMMLFHLGEKVNVEVRESTINVTELDGTLISAFEIH